MLRGLAELLLPRPPSTHTASTKQFPIWQWAVFALGQGLAACARLCLLWHEARGCPSLLNFLDFLSCSLSCQGAGEMLFGAHDIKTFHKRRCQEFPQNPFLPLKGPATLAGPPRASGARWKQRVRCVDEAFPVLRRPRPTSPVANSHPAILLWPGRAAHPIWSTPCPVQPPHFGPGHAPFESSLPLSLR